MSNVFKVNNKDTFINFEHISEQFAHYCTVNIAQFEQIIEEWAWETEVSDEFVSGCCEKFNDLWARKTCCALGFPLYLPNIGLQKDKLSQQNFKKISQTLSLNLEYVATKDTPCSEVSSQDGCLPKTTLSITFWG